MSKFVCEYRVKPGKNATYETGCGKTIISSDNPHGDECICCGRAVKVVRP